MRRLKNVKSTGYRVVKWFFFDSLQPRLHDGGSHHVYDRVAMMSLVLTCFGALIEA